MKSSWKFYLILLLILVGMGCGKTDVSTEPPNPNVVASHDGGVITKGQVKARFDDLMPCCKGRYEGEEGIKALIKEMVLPQVIAQTIKQKKIDLRENIRDKMGNMTEQLNMSFLHMKFHEQILNSDEKYMDLRESYEYQKNILKGVPIAERFNRLARLHEKIHHSIAKEVEQVAEEYIGNLRKEASITKNLDVLRIKGTSEELKDFYQKHKDGLHEDEYRVPEKIKVQEIIITVDREKGKEDCPECTAENERTTREKAESALIELRSGAEFRTVAEKYAGDKDEPIKTKWIARGSNGEAYDEALFSLDAGETGRVLANKDTLSIVKILERKPGRFKAFGEIIEEIEREYRWQKGEEYLKENRDRILFTINAKPYTIGDFIKEYERGTPPHQCHHMEKTHTQEHKKKAQLCDFAHNDFEEKKRHVDSMIDRELIVEDTYDQMIHVEHKEEIEFLTMASLYPLFHEEEMEGLIQITDDMVEAYFKENKETYQYPAKARISMILIRGGESEEDMEKALQRAKMAYEELNASFFSFKKPKDFQEVARKYSDDKETASKGGRLDLDIHECRDAIEYALVHGFHKKIFELKPGEISDVFEFGGNYYILQINDMKSRIQIGFEEVKIQVRKDLMDEEHEKIMAQWEDNLLKSSGFVVYQENLTEFLNERTTDTKES